MAWTWYVLLLEMAGRESTIVIVVMPHSVLLDSVRPTAPFQEAHRTPRPYNTTPRCKHVHVEKGCQREVHHHHPAARQNAVSAHGRALRGPELWHLWRGVGVALSPLPPVASRPPTAAPTATATPKNRHHAPKQTLLLPLWASLRSREERGARHEEVGHGSSNLTLTHTTPPPRRSLGHSPRAWAPASGGPGAAGLLPGRS